MHVLIAGATGAIGRRLVPLLRRRGYRVTALTRSPDHIDAFRAHGVNAVQCDAFDTARLQRVVEEARADAVINQLTSIPKHIHPRRIRMQMAETNKLRRDVTPVLVRAASSAGVRQFLTQSISFVYRPGIKTPATEDEPLNENPLPGLREIVGAVEAMEQAVTGTQEMEGTVLRYGFFYGPGTAYARTGSFAEDVAHRRVPVVGDGGGVFSFVHVDDAAAATVLAIDHGKGGIYNIVDDDPAPLRTWLPEYARALGAPPPRRVPKLLGRMAAGPYGVYFMTEQRGASNQRAKAALGWQPRYASWREGFKAELEEREPSGET